MFLLFRPVIYNGNFWIFNTNYVLHINRAHLRKLHQMRWTCIHIGTTVDQKGNALVKETFPLLKECKNINFIGSIEARDIPAGYADVVVCEAFVGNVILKLYEGVGSALVQKIKEGMMTSTRSKIGALLVKPALKETLKSFDATEYGGAPLLGLKGLVVKTHGSAKAIEIKHGIFQFHLQPSFLFLFLSCSILLRTSVLPDPPGYALRSSR